MNCYEITVSGRVQGVGFRYYTVHRAKELGVLGWVRNQADNSVLIMAQADDETIQTFIDFLYIGPARSRIDHISKAKMNSLCDFDNFSVKY